MPDIHLKTRRLEYKFYVAGKYTIIKGDSATGKTTFYDLVAAVGSSSVVNNIAYKKLKAVPNDFESFRIENFQDYMLVVDGSCSLFRKSNVASILQNFRNYFIFITRKLKLGFLPVHVDNVLQIKVSGKFHTVSRLDDRFTIEKID